MSITDIYQAVEENAQALAPTILNISHDIHAHPELRFQEHHATSLLTNLLKEQLFAVTMPPIAKLDTAFTATTTYGNPDDRQPQIAFVAEYDALPEIGHACGHNIIAAMSVGAALITQRVLHQQQLSGTIAVIGTPAEEGGGGKIFLLDAGVFSPYDAAIMFHPGDHNEAAPIAIAREGLDIHFQGRASHAAAAPEQGIDAVQAVVNFLTLINSMRATLRKDANIHSIITDGGQAPNIIAEHAAVRLQIRARDRAYLDTLLQRVLTCATGAASAVGAQMEWSRFVPAYADMNANATLVDLLRDEMAREDRPSEDTDEMLGSTDMGNVSYALPSLHGNIQVSPRGIPAHTRDFAAAAISASGDNAAIAGAKILARVALRLLKEPELLKQAQAQHPHATSNTAQ
jgi:amidohydrolase